VTLDCLLHLQAVAIRADRDPYLVPLQSSNPDVIAPQPPTPIFSGATSSQSANYVARSAGAVDLFASQPDGFVSSTPLRVRIANPRLGAGSRAVVGKDVQTPVSVFASVGTLDPNVQVTITSLAPDKVLVSPAPDALGQTTVTVAGIGPFYIQGVAEAGSAQIRLQAAGYEDGLLPVDLLPVSLEVIELSPRPGTSGQLRIAFRLRDRSSFADWNGTIRAGLTVPIGLRSLDDSIARLSASSVALKPGSPSEAVVQITFLRPGETAVLLDTPPATPLKSNRIPVVVPNWTFSVPDSITIGRRLMAPVSIYHSRLEPVGARLDSSGDTPVLISSGGTLNIEANRSRTVMVEAPGEGTGAVLRVSAPDFDTAQVKVQFGNPTVLLRYVPALDANAAATNVAVVLGAEFFSSVEQALGTTQSPAVVRVFSSDTSVLRLGTDSLDFRPGESSRALALQPGRAGTATLTLQGPPGFNLPSGVRSYVITVRGKS